MATNQQGAITAYLIDPARRTIEAVELPGGPDHLQDIYRHINCRLITTLPLGFDTIYCDDEGLLNGPVCQFFGVSGGSQLIAGRGLVVGFDPNGFDAAPCATIDMVRAQTFFVERISRDLWALLHPKRRRRCEIGTLAYVQATMAADVYDGSGLREESAA